MRVRELAEWLGATFEAAANNPRANWLFRGHPSDDWYGGMKLRDLMPADRPQHVALAPEDWHGGAVMDGQH